MTSPLDEHAAWLRAAYRNWRLRTDPLARRPLEPVPCFVVDATNDEACHFIEGHTGFHSWQKNADDY